METKQFTVFAAGFSLKRRRFFKYFSEICVFAVLGTVISTVVFGLFTWLLAKLHIVSAAAIGTRPLTECLMYGMCARVKVCVCYAYMMRFLLHALLVFSLYPSSSSRTQGQPFPL